MAKALRTIDITNSPELLRLAEDVRTSNEPRLLRRDSEDVAIVHPVKRARRAPTLRGKPLTAADPLWKLVGSATSAQPTDATKKHEYLAEAFTPHQP